MKRLHSFHNGRTVGVYGLVQYHNVGISGFPQVVGVGVMADVLERFFGSKLKEGGEEAGGGAVAKGSERQQGRYSLATGIVP